MKSRQLNDRLVEWWSENKSAVIEKIQNINTGHSKIRIPVFIDGVIDYVEYDRRTKVIMLCIQVATGEDRTPTGWGDTAVYCNESEYVVAFQETIP